MLRIGICDDSNLFCTQLEDYFIAYAQKENILIETEIFLSGEDYLKFLETEPILNLLFLDIELGIMNGISVGQKMRKDPRNEVTQIVYMSWKDTYAMQLFQNRPMDFLVKPVSIEDIQRVLSEYRRVFYHLKMFFEYKTGKTMVRVSDDDIMYFQSSDKKIEIATFDSGIMKFYGKLTDVILQLNLNKFCIIHKSFIVNINYVSIFRYREVVMTTGTVIPISQSFRNKVQQRILDFSK